MLVEVRVCASGGCVLVEVRVSWDVVGLWDLFCTITI